MAPCKDLKEFDYGAGLFLLALISYFISVSFDCLAIWLPGEKRSSLITPTHLQIILYYETKISTKTCVVHGIVRILLSWVFLHSVRPSVCAIYCPTWIWPHLYCRLSEPPRGQSLGCLQKHYREMEFNSHSSIDVQTKWATQNPLMVWMNNRKICSYEAKARKFIQE